MYDTRDLYRPQRDFVCPFPCEFSIPSGIGHGEGLDSLGLGWIYYGLARSLPAKTVLCIGSAFGYVPAIFGLALKHNGAGTVHFVDASYDYELDGLKSYAGCGFWKQAGRRPFEDLGLDNIELTISTTQDYAWPGGLIDVLFIDGDHSFDGVKHDFEKFSPFANYVLLHDSAWNPDGTLQSYGSNVHERDPWDDSDDSEQLYPAVRKFAATIDRPQISLPIDSGIILIDNRKHREFG